MTAPNPARDAMPGWRGTDPDGGTWALTHADGGDTLPWSHTTSDGEHHWRSQEDAEAAGLVPLLATGDNSRDLLEDAYSKPSSKAAAPAPLDPGNPEDLRRHVRDARVIEDRYEGKFVGFDAANWGLGWVQQQADRLEREAAEQAQEAADRKRAEEIAPQVRGVVYAGELAVDLVLAGIRAGRAERQEAEK